MATWLLVIARNLLVDYLRSARRRDCSFDALAHRASFAAPDDRYDLGPPPDLERALAQLDDRERELIALRFGGDLSCREIAALTGLSLANVQQILSRSLRRMRSSVQPARREVRAASARP